MLSTVRRRTTLDVRRSPDVGPADRNWRRMSSPPRSAISSPAARNACMTSSSGRSGCESITMRDAADANCGRCLARLPSRTYATYPANVSRSAASSAGVADHGVTRTRESTAAPSGPWLMPSGWIQSNGEDSPDSRGPVFDDFTRRQNNDGSLSQRARISPEIVDGFRSLTACELLVEPRSGRHCPGRRDPTAADSVEHHLVHNESLPGWLDVEISP